MEVGVEAGVGVGRGLGIAVGDGVPDIPLGEDESPNCAVSLSPVSL